jgi:hypothetical protein
MKRFLFPVALLGASVVLTTSTASAATLNGITPVSPKKNQSVKVGKSPTFSMKVRGEGTVWVHVCKSAKKKVDGTICSTTNIGQARKSSGSTFKYKPKFFDFPTFWLNTPGTYYWQAHRINCEGDTSDCRQEGPTVKFRVRR